jgi:hypothetical protein
MQAHHRHAVLRQFVGAYFRLSAITQTAGRLLQLATVALAAFPAIRDSLPPASTWLVLVLAALAPLCLWLAQGAKNHADDTLRLIEIADGLGREISQLEVEDTREQAHVLVRAIASRVPLELKPYASAQSPGATRLLANIRESSWWSKHLARELARWHTGWTVLFALAALAALIGVARDGGLPATIVTYRSDIVEFATALLVLIFAEGSFRTSRELAHFADASARIGDRARQMSELTSTIVDVLLLASEYQIARQAAPRLSSFWHKLRKRRLHAAWLRAHRTE